MLMAVAMLALAGAAPPGAAVDDRLVGIKAVSLEFRGFPDESNPAGLSNEELLQVTGLARATWIELKRAVQKDVADTLAQHKVPFSVPAEGCTPGGEATPVLVFTVDASSLTVTPPGSYFIIRAELMEPAQLLRRPTVRGRVATWSNSWTGFAEGGMLPFHIKNAAHFWANAFGESYGRANGMAAQR
jgi:hypothetical protein